MTKPTASLGLFSAHVQYDLKTGSSPSNVENVRRTFVGRTIKLCVDIVVGEAGASHVDLVHTIG